MLIEDLAPINLWRWSGDVNDEQNGDHQTQAHRFLLLKIDTPKCEKLLLWFLSSINFKEYNKWSLGHVGLNQCSCLKNWLKFLFSQWSRLWRPGDYCIVRKILTKENQSPHTSNHPWPSMYQPSITWTVTSHVPAELARVHSIPVHTILSTSIYLSWYIMVHTGAYFVKPVYFKLGWARHTLVVWQLRRLPWRRTLHARNKLSVQWRLRDLLESESE